MECPGLNGLWLACPESIDGLTVAEREFFRFLGEPLLVVAVIGLVALVTLLVFVAADGLSIGHAARTLPRQANVAGAIRRARELRMARVHLTIATQNRRWARSVLQEARAPTLLSPEPGERSPRSSSRPRLDHAA